MELMESGGEKHDKPVATLQCTEDLILPLLGTDDIPRAEESRSTVTHQDIRKTLCHHAILIRMRQEDLGWYHQSHCECTHLVDDLLPVLFASSDLHRIKLAENPGYV
jgi:hypothetical protein